MAQRMSIAYDAQAKTDRKSIVGDESEATAKRNQKRKSTAAARSSTLVDMIRKTVLGETTAEVCGLYFLLQVISHIFQFLE